MFMRMPVKYVIIFLVKLVVLRGLLEEDRSKCPLELSDGLRFERIWKQSF